MLIFEFKTCAFLQAFYRMRCVSKISFISLLPSKLDDMEGEGEGGNEFGSAAKIIHPS